jgi:tRNA nucleotidyltransferase/poly(A) polymerase
MEHLPAGLARAARSAARVLGAAGHRTWLVGGAVRDLALARLPEDADLASAARPEEVEALFPATHAVGRAFGTVVVPCEGLDLQITTFRADEDYDDARRPSRVHFAASLEEDARRRDFTCNALYLDPLNDELADPTGGLGDLAARVLRCVGQPEQRFAEDGLRLLRLARLAAQNQLAIEPATLAGARASLASLRGVSPERIHAELVRMATGLAPARAASLLLELGVLEQLPGLSAPGQRAALAARVEALARLEKGSAERFFAVLFDPGAKTELEPALEGLWELRPPRSLHQRVARTLGLARELAALLAELARGHERRSRWIRIVRAPEFEDALAVWSARHPGEREAERERLAELSANLTPAERWPRPLVTSAELERCGVPRGPRWAELLRAGEDAQLDGELTDLASARAWLARRATE